MASTNFTYFYWYSVVRTLYISSQTLPKPPSTAIELSLGAVAGAVAQIFTIPVSVVTTRQQTQPRGEKKGLIDTGREVVNSEDGWTGLWRGLKASLVLVVNPAITYGAYQRLKDIIYPGKMNLRPLEAFRTLQPSFSSPAIPLTNPSSPRRPLQIHRHNRHPTPYSGKSRSAITTSTSTSRKAFQIFHRSHELHHRARRTASLVQGHRPTDY